MGGGEEDAADFDDDFDEVGGVLDSFFFFFFRDLFGVVAANGVSVVFTAETTSSPLL